MTGADRDRYPDDWSDRRERVLRRDGYRCRKCGARGTQSGGSATLHVHHVDGASPDLSNLVTLCAACHAVVDSKPELRESRTRTAKRGARNIRRVGGRSRRR